MNDNETKQRFVKWFRNAAPYINAFRDRTFVLLVGGETLSEAQFPALVHDIALLNSLGVRLVLVHGARPQIEQRLRADGAEIRYVDGLRVTDDTALACVKEAVGSVRVEIEALLSMGLANSPMAGARIRVASGNFVTARPLGVRKGTDFCHTGEVRRVDTQAINQQLAEGAIVLLSPLGYSPTGEVFNLSAEEVATTVAAELASDKLIMLVDGNGLLDGRGRLVHELTLDEARAFLAAETASMPPDIEHALRAAVQACTRGVRRAHLINRHIDGALLQELFTRDGVGTMVAGDPFEGIRRATIDDVGGILELIAPLEADGILVRRSREVLETEIGKFVVVERDDAIIACAGLYPCVSERLAELACLVVHPDYQGEARASTVLAYLEREARTQGIDRLFVLTTQAVHWFREQGFEPAELSSLPVERQALYNLQRNSKVLIKELATDVARTA